MAEPIRVLIADDHPIVREGVRVLLRAQPDLLLVGEASDGVEAVQQVEALRPDVVMMDLMMPRQDGIEATQQIMRQHPATRVIILTSFPESAQLRAAFDAGAVGFLLKDVVTTQVVHVIRVVHEGATVWPPSLFEHLAPATPRAAPSVNSLTPRESEILRLLAQGLSNREIAQRLGLTSHTAATHVRNILGKLQLANRTQAALYARDQGLL